MQAQLIHSTPIRQCDARADGREREIFIERSHIIIARGVAGVRMRINVPVRCYRGVVLALNRTSTGRDSYRVSLWHADRDFSVTLLEASDDSEIVAVWKSWAAFFSLPKFIESEPGQLESAERSLGGVLLGRAGAPRRRGAVMAARRSRRRLLRKAGAAAPRGAGVNGHDLIAS